MLNRLKYARFGTKSRKLVCFRSVWLGLGPYFIEIDPIWSRMPPIYLPDSKIPLKIQPGNPGNREKSGEFPYYSPIPLPGQ